MSPRLIVLALLLLTGAVYWPIAGHDFVYDDAEYVVNNLHVQRGFNLGDLHWAFTTFHQANWHPLTWLSHLLDVRLFGLHPSGHHVVSLLFHASSAVLLFLVLRRMTGAQFPSAFVAALFAVHPLHVESVSWVAERKDVLSAFFGILALGAYVRYLRRPRAAGYLPVLLLFALGLMAKPMLVTWPFVLMLLDYWPLGRLRSLSAKDSRPLFLEKVPLLVLSALSCAITWLAQAEGGAVNLADRSHLVLRLTNAAVSYVRYVGRMLWPTDLAVFYPLAPDLHPVWTVIGSLAILGGISLTAAIWRRRLPFAAVGWLWYLGTMVPVIGLVQVGGQSMADRYTYLPLIGLFVAAAWGIRHLAAGRRIRQGALTVAGVAVITAMAILSSRQVRHWRNGITLFTRDLEVTGPNVVGHNNLGLALLKAGRIEEARGQFTLALRSSPDFGKARLNLANVLLEQGRLDDAAAHYRELLDLDPGSAEAHHNLGMALSRLGKTDEALLHYREALRLNPELADTHNNLGTSLERLGRSQEAAGHFRRALELDPRSEKARNNLGAVLAAAGRVDEAVEHYREALRIRPDYYYAHVNLALALERSGRREEALAHARKALELQPRNAKTNAALTRILSSTSDRQSGGLR